MSGAARMNRRLSGVTLRDSAWLTGVLALAALPLAGEAGMAVVALFLICAALHLRTGWLGRTLPAWVRWVALAAGFGTVYATHQAFSGMEAGMATLVVLFGSKLLELRTRREYQIACCLGYFLILCGLFFSQEFVLCLYEGAIFFLLTLVLRRFHSGGAAGGARLTLRERAREVGPLLRASAIAILQAAPVVFILFCFFPRAPEGFGLQFLRRNMTGMSDHLSPGGVEELVKDGSPAFRVRFTQGTPKNPLFYWRGLVLWECDGLEWRKGAPRGFATPVPERLATQIVAQEILIEPHGSRWLFSLDQPLSPPAGADLLRGRYLESRRSVDYRQLYHVVSGAVRERPEPDLLEAALQLPPPGEIPERVLALAQSWEGTPREKVRAAVRFFSQNFTYTLESGAYRGNGWAMLDTFLFERKRGFCSHFSAAFASLMRMGGVPSRIVMGYMGGAYNPLGDFYAVTQADAHAWCEVWLEGEGWVRIDPTLFVPGGRGNSSTRAAAAENPAAADLAHAPARESASQLGFFKRIGYRWEAFNYQWTVWVLGYDREVQREFFDTLGLARLSRGVIFLWAMVAILLFLVGLRFFLKWSSRGSIDPIARSYGMLCRKLEKIGLPRDPAEAPAAYLERILATRPDLGRTLSPLFEQYILLLYAPWKLGNPVLASRLLRRRVAALKLAPAAV